MQKVMLFKFGEVAEVELPFPPANLIFNRTLLMVNGQVLIKTAQAHTPERDIILLVRPIVELPGIIEGEAAIKAERADARRHGAGWLDKRDCPLEVVWEQVKEWHEF